VTSESVIFISVGGPPLYDFAKQVSFLQESVQISFYFFIEVHLFILFSETYRLAFYSMKLSVSYK
jgi:hypothetical protein